MNDIDRARLKRGGPKPPPKPAGFVFELKLEGWPGGIIGMVLVFALIYTVITLTLRVLP